MSNETVLSSTDPSEEDIKRWWSVPLVICVWFLICSFIFFNQKSQTSRQTYQTRSKILLNFSFLLTILTKLLHLMKNLGGQELRHQRQTTARVILSPPDTNWGCFSLLTLLRLQPNQDCDSTTHKLTTNRLDKSHQVLSMCKGSKHK